MRLSRYITLLFGIFALTALSNCSRESSVKENVSLKNNHSRVFALRTAFEDPKAFADSIANTAVNENDSLPDTLTVTINDTIYLMGILPYNVDKIYRFQWNLTKSDGKDTIIVGDNAKPQGWAYSKTGVYYPLFIAFDGNNSTDTAGTDTKQTYIKVINTKPTLSVPKDTLWTTNKGDITFPIVASDSFGSIKKILVDLDASGKDSAQVWKYETKENNDSLYLTIKNDPKKIDSLGNQKIYITIVDDDDNKTTDSVNLHFNRLPKLKVLYPLDGARHNISERFYFYYEGSDQDNPQDLKYFIYAQVSKNGQPPVKAFDSNDLIAEDFAATIFEPTNSEGKNVITLVNNPTKELTGRIYWDMYVTDGYDIVHMERISTGENSSRPWSFYIGDLKSTQGSISGVAQYQGREDHSGINVELSNGIKTYNAVTDSRGNYTIKVDAGSYTAIASSKISEFTADTLKEMYLESGVILTADSMLLKDKIVPSLMVMNIDTIKVRTLKQTVYARDIGAGVKSVAATHNKEDIDLNCNIIDQGAVYNCEFNLDSLEDGVHNFVYTAIDKAGNKSEIKQNIVVNATNLSLDVNGAQKQLIGEGQELTFNAQVINALPPADSVKWTYVIGNDTTTHFSKVDKDGNATFTLKYSDITKAEESKDYYMTVSYSKGNVNLSTKVAFGILGNNPAVIFTKPGINTRVTMNDPIEYGIEAYPGKLSTGLTIEWTCPEQHLSNEFSCPSPIDTITNEKISKTASLAFDTIGTYKVKVKVTDNDGLTSTDSIEVSVISDAPTIKATTDQRTNEYKINASAAVTLNASDKFGTVDKISWGCSNGSIIKFDNESTLPTPAAVVNNFKINIQLPPEPKTHKCKFMATDDDGEIGLDSLTFVTLLDPPSVKLAVKQDTVKIKSTQTITANAVDKLGSIVEYNIACNEELSALKNPDWTVMPGPSITELMPSTATNYYCIVKVLDDDNNAAFDTATYKVVVGRPSVTAVLASAYEVVTIKDTIELNAVAHDSLGSLVKYEWGCGSAGSTNIGFTISSSTTPRAQVVMPSKAQDDYSCIIRVTDDDGNTASDTAHIKVILAPPTVKVSNKTLTVREGFNMALGATASDNNNVSSDPGAIVKREWSCGIPNEIANNWKTVSAFDTVWKAPAPQVSYYCVARVTDNDDNTASDTIQIKFSTQQPIIQVADELIYINVGDNFSLSATVNDVWQGIDWFTWECKDKATGTSFEKDGKAPKYDYKANGGNMSIGKDSTYSEHEKDMYCIVSAQETSTKATFKDTTEVRILKQHPKGVISAADTVYLWSGDNNVDDEAIYFYTKEWGGMKSQMGELGKAGMEDFYWNFSNVDGAYYQGNHDGSLDTSIAQFNNAFIRSTTEGSITISLDYRDSTTTSATRNFYSRHRAPEVKRKVYFRKAWENLAKDTVLESTGKQTAAPAMDIINDNPVSAFATSNKLVAKASIFKNGSWTTIGTVTTTDSIVAVKLTNNGSDLFMGVLSSTGDFTVYKSTGASSAFSKVGSSIAKVSSPKLLCQPNQTNPIVIYIGSADKQNNIAKFESNTWKTSSIARLSTGNSTTLKSREIDAIFLPSGELVIVAVDTTSNYTAYASLYSSSLAQKTNPTSIGRDINKITLAASGTKVYLGFSNRDVEKYGPYIYEGSVSGSNISWNKSGIYSKPIFEGYIAYHISVAVNNGVIYAALDDNGKPDYSQIHVFKLEGGKWHFYGENELPYFGTNFYEKNKYYLRGSNPQLAVDGAGKIHLSMLARENAHGTSTTNNGPIIMKYVADNWEIHE